MNLDQYAKLTRQRQVKKSELNQIIIGWLSFSMGYQNKVMPKGFGGGVEGEEVFTEERWCWDRVEAALGKYTEPYRSVGDGYDIRASKQMRSWLRDIYWDSVPMSSFKDSEWLVAGQIRLFRVKLREETTANPRPREYETV